MHADRDHVARRLPPPALRRTRTVVTVRRGVGGEDVAMVDPAHRRASRGGDDGQARGWRDGQDLMFDETFIHTAENRTDQPRIILFCDVERPLNNPLARGFNWLVGRTLAAASASRNRQVSVAVANPRSVGGYAP